VTRPAPSLVEGLLTAAGIDAAQWKRLVRVFLKIDFGGLRQLNNSAEQRMAFGLFFTALLYLVSGLPPALTILASCAFDKSTNAAVNQEKARRFALQAFVQKTPLHRHRFLQ
jgi:hypothetical protein